MTKLGISLVMLVLASHSLAGCSDDETGGGKGGYGGTTGGAGGTGGTGVTGGAGGTAGTGAVAGGGTGGTAGGGAGGTAGGATGGTAGGGTGGTAGLDGGGAGGTDGGGAGGTDGGSAAQLFCSGYAAKCGFGATGHYADEADCIAKYNSFSTARQGCVEQHLGYATSSTDIHCTHAAGAAPCN